jgi:hypothetical protein
VYPPWLTWFGSTAGGRTRARSVSSPVRLPPQPADVSYAGTHRLDVDRSVTEGSASRATAASRAGGREGPC